jgi:hypothetical protein
LERPCETQYQYVCLKGNIATSWLDVLQLISAVCITHDVIHIRCVREPACQQTWIISELSWTIASLGETTNVSYQGCNTHARKNQGLEVLVTVEKLAPCGTIYTPLVFVVASRIIHGLITRGSSRGGLKSWLGGYRNAMLQAALLYTADIFGASDSQSCCESCIMQSESIQIYLKPV